MSTISAARFLETAAPLVTLPQDRAQVLAPPPPRKRKKPTVVSVGSVAIKVYKTRWYDKKRRRAYTKHAIIWKDGSGRHREQHASLEAATRRAREIANDLANGQISMQQFSQADRARFELCRQLEAKAGRPMELLLADAADALSLLSSSGAPLPSSILAELARFWLQHHPAGAAPKTCPEILAELIPARKRDGASKNTLDDLESRLGKFCQHFQGSILSITPADLNEWLRKLPVSRRTRNNYRGNLVDFYRFAKQAGYVPKAWSPLDEVPRVKNEPVKIEIFTPEEITKLLAARITMELDAKRTRWASRVKTLVPYLAIAAFGGVRNEEMCAQPGPDGKPLPVLDWREVDFESGEIRVLPEVARKIGHDRILPMQDNLVAWLRPYAKPNGPICELANVVNALLDTAQRAGVAWKDNGLRKSFISYRLSITENIGTVAQEAGTSPDRIRHNYKKTVPKREAKRWFGVYPTSADILQLPLFGAKAMAK